MFNLRSFLKCFLCHSTAGLLIAASFSPAFAGGNTGGASRIKDIADIEYVRENQLIGHGLVVGLKGTGDSLSNAPFTEQELRNQLENLGVSTLNQQLNTANVATVFITANLPPFATQGARIDVTVSAHGDASSLQGGTLLATPLWGKDGNIYAVAQGQIAVGGFSAEGRAATVIKGVPTSGRITNGAIVEREIDFRLEAKSNIRLSLRNPDFTTSRRIAEAINELQGGAIATASDPATVRITLPFGFDGTMVDLMTDIEQIRVTPDSPAKVVIDEHTGIIVMGSDVRISTVAVAQGNLTISIRETPIQEPNIGGGVQGDVNVQINDSQNVVQQNNLGGLAGQNAVLPRTEITVQEKDGKVAIVENGISLAELVDGLNSLGVGPRDLISILQAIKAAGAMQAEVEVI